MTRKEFLTELDRRLEVLPRREADRYLDYYAEILADRVEDGMTDEESVASLESLDTITTRILGKRYTAPKRRNRDRRTAIFCGVLIAGLVSLIVLLIVGAATFSTHSTTGVEAPIVTEEMEYHSITIPAGDIRSISINWVSDALSFTVWEGNEILLECYDERLLEYAVEGDKLTIGRDSEPFSITAGSSLFITIPRTLAERRLEELTISVTSACVDLFEINADRLELSTVSGSCTVDGLFDEVSVTTTSGDIHFYGSFERGSFDTVSGCLDISADSTVRSLQADSVSGSVILTLPQGTGFSLEFDSVSGKLYSDEYGTLSGESSFTYGDGSAEITLDTISGDVTLIRS